VTDGWLVVIDPQAVFASPETSPWGTPAFADAWPNIERLAAEFGDRVVVTRWLPTADRSGSWGDYFAEWPFADVPADDPLYDLVPGAAALSPHPTVDLPTFGKWGDELRAATRDAQHLTLCGVSTDCCVIETALAAADAGKHVRVVRDACAASTPENGAAALAVMSLFAPQLTLVGR
jgi:nicotinamidase-related amidase